MTWLCLFFFFCCCFMFALSSVDYAVWVFVFSSMNTCLPVTPERVRAMVKGQRQRKREAASSFSVLVIYSPAVGIALPVVVVNPRWFWCVRWSGQPGGQRPKSWQAGLWHSGWAGWEAEVLSGVDIDFFTFTFHFLQLYCPNGISRMENSGCFP